MRGRENGASIDSSRGAVGAAGQPGEEAGWSPGQRHHDERDAEGGSGRPAAADRSGSPDAWRRLQVGGGEDVGLPGCPGSAGRPAGCPGRRSPPPGRRGRTTRPARRRPRATTRWCIGSCPRERDHSVTMILRTVRTPATRRTTSDRDVTVRPRSVKARQPPQDRAATPRRSPRRPPGAPRRAARSGRGCRRPRRCADGARLGHRLHQVPSPLDEVVAGRHGFLVARCGDAGRRPRAG